MSIYDPKESKKDPKDKDSGQDEWEKWHRHLEACLEAVMGGASLEDSQREKTEGMVRTLVREIRQGRHPRIAVILSRDDERADELRGELVQEITEYVSGNPGEAGRLSDAYLHYLDELDHAQHGSALETRMEEFLRRLRSGHLDDPVIENYCEWKQTEGLEAAGQLPEGSARALQEEMERDGRPFPKGAVFHALEDLWHYEEEHEAAKTLSPR